MILFLTVLRSSVLVLGWVAAADAQVRSYQDVGSDVELGVAHAGGDIDLVAGVSRTAGKAARAFISPADIQILERGMQDEATMLLVGAFSVACRSAPGGGLLA